MNTANPFAGYRFALGDCPPTQSAVHDWVARTSKCAEAAGIAPEQAWQEIVDTVACATIQPCEVWDAVERAYAPVTSSTMGVQNDLQGCLAKRAAPTRGADPCVEVGYGQPRCNGRNSHRTS